MAKKKDWNNWINSVDEYELKDLMKSDYTINHIPQELETNVSQLIKTYKKEHKANFFEILYNILFPPKNSIRLAYSLTILLFIITVSLLLTFFIYPNISKKHSNICKITSVDGKGYIIDSKTNEKKQVKLNQIINETDKIISDKNSRIQLTINEKSEIILNNKSEIYIKKLFKDKKLEKTNILVTTGKVVFKPSKVDMYSYFKVETNAMIVDVKGTVFSVEVDDKKISRINVDEGNVKIKAKLGIDKNIKYINKIDKIFAEELKKSIEKEIDLHRNQQVEISYYELVDTDKKITDIIKNIKTDLKINKKEKKEIEKILKNSDIKIEKIEKLKEELIKKETKITDFKYKEDSEKIFNIFAVEKIDFGTNINFSQKNTAITTDGRNIYITSNLNKQIYCLNPENKNIKWSFTHNDGLTSPAVKYKSYIVFSTPNKIFILDQTGKLIKKHNITIGPSFWSSPVQINDKLYIPAFMSIYKLEDTSLSQLKNLSNKKGELYISSENNTLYINDSNTENITSYDLISNNIIRTSYKIQNRAFISPGISDKYLLIADMYSSLYRFDKNIKSPAESLQIKTGVMTNIIIDKNFVYYIANDGYFHKVNLEKFNTYDRIEKVDKNPNRDIYLTKKLIKESDFIFFSSDTGNIFIYHIPSGKSKLLENIPNENKNPLIGTPVNINGKIYFIDTKMNIYALYIKK